jgi:hypothetical protein
MDIADDFNIQGGQIQALTAHKSCKTQDIPKIADLHNAGPFRSIARTQSPDRLTF